MPKSPTGARVSTARFNYSYIQGLINWNADGYRLPDIILARKLLTGGSHKKKWPWGDTLDPLELNAQARASTFPSEFGPTPASNRQPNGFGIKDLLGNVAEWSESGHHDVGDGMKIDIYGGSYKSSAGHLRLEELPISTRLTCGKLI